MDKGNPIGIREIQRDKGNPIWIRETL